MSEARYCCRLDQETIVAIVRNRSGMDSGEIDYTLRGDSFDRQDAGSLGDMISTMENLIEMCKCRIFELKKESV